MKTVESYPEEVGIWLPSGGTIEDVPIQYFSVPRFTALFRDGETLLDLVDMTIDRFGTDKPLSVLSVGCSVGAEADSVLSLLKYRGVGQTSLVGCDVRQDVIDVAQKGQYVAKAIMDDEKSQRVKRTLKKYGFTITSYCDSEHEETDSSGVFYRFNSGHIRSDNSVDFILHDLAEEGPINGFRPDLVLIHNLLYQIPVLSRRKILENVKLMMPKDGILSLEGWAYSPVDTKYKSSDLEDKIGFLDRYQATGLFHPTR